MERRQISSPDLRRRSLCRVERLLAGNCDVRAKCWVDLLDPLQVCLDDLGRRQLLLADELRQLERGQRHDGLVHGLLLRHVRSIPVESHNTRSDTVGADAEPGQEPRAPITLVGRERLLRTLLRSPTPRAWSPSARRGPGRSAARGSPRSGHSPRGARSARPRITSTSTGPRVACSNIVMGAPSSCESSHAVMDERQPPAHLGGQRVLARLRELPGSHRGADDLARAGPGGCRRRR